MTDLGILLALLCALLTNLGFLYKHRGANRAPDVDWRHPGRSAPTLLIESRSAVGITEEHVEELLAWVEEVTVA